MKRRSINALAGILIFLGILIPVMSFGNSELCAVIEYRALNNKVEVAVGNIKTKGTEQYWGNTWISLKTKQLEFGEIYSSTFQEIEVNGMKDKLLAKTIRELKVERIK